MISFTTIVGLDEEHLEEFRFTWPTWVAHRPELGQRPIIFICDGSWEEARWDMELEFVTHRRKSIALWDQDGVDQREKMLTALALLPPQIVTTPWYLKLDADAVVKSPGRWPRRKWFRPDEQGRRPVLVAPRWGYTTPANAIERLDEWADNIPGLREHERLGLKAEPGAERIVHPRITSWCCFVQTEWAGEIAATTDGRLPVPSQDTFHWYCAARRREFYRAIRPHGTGWKHCGRKRSLHRMARLSCVTESTIMSENSTPHPTSPVGASMLPRRSSNELGVIYLLTGISHAARLVVSIASLREYYKGPITLFTTRRASHRIGEQLAQDPRLGIEHRMFPELYEGKNSSLLIKATLPRFSPYRRTVFLDADTLVAGPLDELLDEVRRHSLVLTQFSHWTTSKRLIKRRINSWDDVCLPEMRQQEWKQLLRRSKQALPAINTGVFGFTRDTEDLTAWQRLALLGRAKFICDEIAMQLLSTDAKAKILDCRWNCSPIHASETSDARIWHFHGDKHLRPQAQEIWLPHFLSCYEANLGGLAQWCPARDGRLSRWLDKAELTNGLKNCSPEAVPHELEFPSSILQSER